MGWVCDIPQCNVNKRGDSSPYTILKTSININFFNGITIQYYNLSDQTSLKKVKQKKSLI